MVLYYRGPHVRITHEVLEVRHPSYQAFRIRDLGHVRVVEETADPATVTSVRSGSTGMAGAAAVVIGLGYANDPPVLDSPALTLGLLALLLVSMTAAGACWRFRRIRYELLAVYRGRLVTLFRTTDSHAFGQVKRGLIRAMQSREDTR